MTGVQFYNVGDSASIPLQAIKPIGDGASDTVNIQTLDSAGYTVDSYMWIDYAGPDWDQKGWIDVNAEMGEYYELVTDVSFAPGEGLWVFGQAGLSIQSAGEVGKSDVTVELITGAVGVSNPFPATLNLVDILPEGEGASDTVNVQTLDSAGYTVDSYMWIDYAGPDWDQKGWIDVNAEMGDYYELVTDVTFAPGEGLWVFGQPGLSIVIPAPEF